MKEQELLERIVAAMTFETESDAHLRDRNGRYDRHKVITEVARLADALSSLKESVRTVREWFQA